MTMMSPAFAPLDPAERASLDDDGYVVIEDLVPLASIDGLQRRIQQLFDELGARAGHEFKQEPQTDRLANLVDCDEIFRWAIALPKLLACVAHMLGPELKLSSLNARSA